MDLYKVHFCCSQAQYGTGSFFGMPVIHVGTFRERVSEPWAGRAKTESLSRQLCSQEEARNNKVMPEKLGRTQLGASSSLSFWAPRRI